MPLKEFEKRLDDVIKNARELEQVIDNLLTKRKQPKKVIPKLKAA